MKKYLSRRVCRVFLLFFTVRQWLTLLIGISGSLAHAQTGQHGTVCSVSRQGIWAVAHQGSYPNAVCVDAVEKMASSLRQNGIRPEVTPAYDTVIQSFYQLGQNNRVSLSCKKGNGRDVEFTFSGHDDTPIVKAVQYAESQPELSACRVAVFEAENTRSTTAFPKGLTGFCGYASESGRWTLRISQPGYGRDVACAAAREDIGREKIDRRSAGYFWSNHSTAFGFECVGESASRVVSGFNDLVAFRNERRQVNTDNSCVFVSDILGYPSEPVGGLAPQ